MESKRPLRPLAVAACIAAIAALTAPAGAAAAPATHFELTVPTTVTAGVPFTFSVRAIDNNGVTDTSYSGTVTFSSDDPTATLPPPQTLTSGAKTFTDGATLTTQGCRRITASDGTLATSSPPIGVTGCDLVDSRAGSLTAQDPVQTGRLAFTPPAGQCNTTLTPMLFSATGSRAYDAYTHVNLANNPICVTVDVNPAAADCDDGAISNASYLDAFNPADPAANYVSDPGTSSGEVGQVMSSSYTVPAGGRFVDVVHATDPSGTCGSYFYLLSADRPFPLSVPTAIGTPEVGSVLGWDTGRWAGSPDFSYEWRRCDVSGGGCVGIQGATSGTHAVGPADVGSTLRIRVFASDALGVSTTDSPPTGVVQPAAAPVGPVATGRRARALRKCKKVRNKAKRKKCRKRARKLPV